MIHGRVCEEEPEAWEDEDLTTNTSSSLDLELPLPVVGPAVLPPSAVPPTGSEIVHPPSAKRRRVTKDESKRKEQVRGSENPVKKDEAGGVVIIGQQTAGTLEGIVEAHRRANRQSDGKESSDEEEGMLVLQMWRRENKERPKDPNFGKCDEDCYIDKQISQQGKNTYVCRRHQRQHVCDVVSGDTHPLIFISLQGIKTCLFSCHVVGTLMVTQDYSKRDPCSRFILPDLSQLNRVISEAEVVHMDSGSLGSRKSRKRFKTMCAGAGEREEGDDGDEGGGGGERGDSSDFCGTGEGGKSKQIAKASQTVVRERVIHVLSVLCDKKSRQKIRMKHAKAADREITKRVSTYCKQCRRRGVKRIVPYEEDIVSEVYVKHERFAPNVTPAQIELWSQTVELLWFHFGPYRKKPRAGAALATDSSAGATPFIFGSLYAMAEGLLYERKNLLERDAALTVVMPPAVDLPLLGFKHQFKSLGRKMLMRAIDASITKSNADLRKPEADASKGGIIQWFLEDVVALRTRLAKKYGEGGGEEEEGGGSSIGRSDGMKAVERKNEK